MTRYYFVTVYDNKIILYILVELSVTNIFQKVKREIDFGHFKKCPYLKSPSNFQKLIVKNVFTPY